MSKLVMAFGSFDILHRGHLLYLNEAKKLGDKLYVVVARDDSIRMMKGRNPIFGEKDRIAVIGALKAVDNTILGNRISSEADRLRIIKRYKPDIIAFGYDQKINTKKTRDWLLKNGITAEVVRITKRADPGKYKSSIARRKLNSKKS
jgi:FAD synthetase